MAEELTQPRPSRRRRRVPPGFVAMAERAKELGLTAASLRRYIKLGHISGQTARVGNRVYVARDLTATPVRPRRRRPVGQGQVSGRRALLTRQTGETSVTVEINLDGIGQGRIQTGNAMLDHLLQQLSRHGLFDLRVEAQGDALPDAHHLVEDVAIVMGRGLRQALGEGRGIRRMGSALVPLDETLVQVAVDAGGRGYAVVQTQLEGAQPAGLPGELVGHFLERFALEGGLTLHARVLAGTDPHHKAEALFKALARALRAAVELDPRAASEVPSTKGTISG